MQGPVKIVSRDVIGGLCLLLTGLAIAGYAYANYRLGSLRVVGPGFLPFWLGLILAFSGAMIVLGSRSLLERVDLPELRPLVMIVLSILAFVVGMTYLGLIPALVMLTTICAFGQRDRTIGSLVWLNVAALILAIGIFRLILGIRFTLFQWPL